MGTYTIGEVAERSGFSASALCYYETARRLASPATDGPCSAECACLPLGGTPA